MLCNLLNLKRIHAQFLSTHRFFVNKLYSEHARKGSNDNITSSKIKIRIPLPSELYAEKRSYGWIKGKYR
jgi:hypothetical protein